MCGPIPPSQSGQPALAAPEQQVQLDPSQEAEGQTRAGAHRVGQCGVIQHACPRRHVFAHQKDKMGLFMRTVDINRAEAKVTLANLAYKMRRLAFHERRATM